MKAFVEYDQPGRSGGNEHVRRPTAEAIALQRQAGRVRAYEYASDAAALADFCCLHWAWEAD